MKNIIAFISLFICTNCFAQHLIITNNNDTIEVKILEKDDSIYHVKRLEKPKREEYIAESLIKKIIAIGDDTLFNIYSSKPIDLPIVVQPIKSETKQNAEAFNDFKSQSYWLNKAGDHMSSAITLNLIGTTFIACSGFLVQEKKKEFNFIGANNVQYSIPYYENDFTLVYVSAGLGVVMNLLSIASWYECSESLKKASQFQKISFKASPVGASVAFRF